MRSPESLRRCPTATTTIKTLARATNQGPSIDTACIHHGFEYAFITREIIRPFWRVMIAKQRPDRCHILPTPRLCPRLSGMTDSRSHLLTSDCCPLVSRSAWWGTLLACDMAIQLLELSDGSGTSTDASAAALHPKDEPLDCRSSPRCLPGLAMQYDPPDCHPE
jgi:hypothetical protein